MRDLSVVIAARNERFLANTVADVLAHIEADTEVIVVLDGAPADPPMPKDPRIVVLAHGHARGQRQSVNAGVRLSTARFVMKLDAHCATDQGFDRKLIEPYDRKELGPDVTTVPRLYNLHCFDWQCQACGERTYQGARPSECGKCHSKAGHERAMVWTPRWHRMTDFTRFDYQMVYQYWSDYRHRPAAQGDLAETMSQLGACYFLSRDRFWELGGLDEQHGSWGQMGTEMSCKSWLSGGRQVCNKRTWYSHMFRTHSGPEWGFPYPQSQKQIDNARALSRAMWYENAWSLQRRPLAWLLERFWPVLGWDNADAAPTLTRVQKAGAEFLQRRGDVAA